MHRLRQNRSSVFIWLARETPPPRPSELMWQLTLTARPVCCNCHPRSWWHAVPRLGREMSCFSERWRTPFDQRLATPTARRQRWSRIDAGVSVKNPQLPPPKRGVKFTSLLAAGRRADVIPADRLINNGGLFGPLLLRVDTRRVCNYDLRRPRSSRFIQASGLVSTLKIGKPGSAGCLIGAARAPGTPDGGGRCQVPRFS